MTESSEYPPRRNINLVIAYNGMKYHGWQRQADGIDTVQQRIEDAALQVMKHRVILFGTGRTDAGVHAEGQCANFYTQNFSIPLKGMRRAINSRLPSDIVIRSAREVPDEFHASRSAVGKTYRYCLFTAPERPVFRAGQVWHYWRKLDIEPMKDAAARLVGRHDFRGFATSAEVRDNTERTIYRCDVARTGPEILIHVQGDGFLYNMVRNIVGTLTEIGRGRWQPDRIDTVLRTRNRRDAGVTAPPDGLTMQCVHFDPAELGT
ncbi:MAG: tRNA pseudouridine(38-40) synthase TruA [Phycisphaerae bacterium]